jgi:hypothetical protein
MARIRTYKPDFLRHEVLQELETKNPGKYPMFVFLGLWSVCDKQGVFPWKPKTLKLDIYPFLDFDMEETLLILLDAGFIRKFVAKEDQESYGHVVNFEKHQRITGDEGKNPSKYPPPQDTSPTQERHSHENGKRKGKGKGMEGDLSFSGFSESNSQTEFIRNHESDPKPESNPQDEPDPHPPDPPPDQKAGSKEDATAVFQKARSLWNERKIPPECRDLIIPPSEYDCLRTFQNYSWKEIENAIKNYDWHFKNWKHGPDWKPPPGYKSIFGFLKNGVSQYCEDEDFKKLFQEKKHGD